MSKIQVDTSAIEISASSLKNVKNTLDNTVKRVRTAKDVLSGEQFSNALGSDVLTQLNGTVHSLEKQERLLQEYIKLMEQATNNLLELDRSSFGKVFIAGELGDVATTVLGQSQPLVTGDFNIFPNVFSALTMGTLPGITTWLLRDYSDEIYEMLDIDSLMNTIAVNIPTAAGEIEQGELPEAIDDFLSEYKTLLGGAGKLLGDSDFEKAGSMVGLIHTVSNATQDALKGEADGETYLELLEDGFGAADKLLDSDRLGFLSDMFGLIKEEMSTVTTADGDIGTFLTESDGLISAAGKMGKAIGKFIGLVESGAEGSAAAGEALTAVTTAATMTTHLVGNIMTYREDGSMDLQDWANTAMDVGVSGGSSLVKGLTLGLVDIDVEKASSIYTSRAEAVTDYLYEQGLPLEAQCVLGVVSSPAVFVVSTAEIAVDTIGNTIENVGKGIQLLDQGIDWVKGQVVSGVLNLLK